MALTGQRVVFKHLKFLIGIAEHNNFYSYLGCVQGNYNFTLFATVLGIRRFFRSRWDYMLPDKFEFVSNALLAEVKNVSDLSVPSCLCLIVTACFKTCLVSFRQIQSFLFPLVLLHFHFGKNNWQEGTDLLVLLLFCLTVSLL